MPWNLAPEIVGFDQAGTITFETNWNYRTTCTIQGLLLILYKKDLTIPIHKLV